MRAPTVVATVGGVLLALGTGLAGPAAADNDWAAAAESPTAGNGHIAWGPLGKQQIEANALGGCAGAPNYATDCVIIASSAQCVAIATSPSHDDVAYAGGSGPTVEAASRAAIASLKKRGKGFNDAQVEPGQDTGCSTDDVTPNPFG
jgi:hypothetical protein